MHKYQYKDFEIDVAVQSDVSWSRENERASTGYVVVVTISRMGGSSLHIFAAASRRL